MKSARFLAFGIFTISLANSSWGAPVVTLLSDDFNDGVINLSLWSTNSTANSNSSVSEGGGKLTLQSRGYLIANVGGLDPVNDGPIRIRGELTLAMASFPDQDFLQVVTRSDATPFGAFGEVQNGVSFEINGNDFIRISTWQSGVQTFISPFVPLQVDDGDSFFFEAIDDGLHLLLSVSEIGGQGATASVSATSNLVLSDLVTFYNRELSTSIAQLDNVEIARVPEASSVLLVSLAGFALLIARSHARSRPGLRTV